MKLGVYEIRHCLDACKATTLKSHPVQVKEPYGNSKWLLVGLHPATRSVQSTPAWNVREGVWQYVEKEKKRERKKIQPGQHISYKHNTYTTVASPVYIWSKILCNFLNNQKSTNLGFKYTISLVVKFQISYTP